MDLLVRNLETQEDKNYCYHEIDTMAVEPTDTLREIYFITSSKNKVAELKQRVKIKHAKLKILSIDLGEIQHSNVLNIVEDKCKRAFDYVNKLPADESYGARRVKRSILVEDTCLNFKALNGLPGPYIKWFVEAIKPEGLYKMLVGFEDKTAEATCTYALMEDERKIVFCIGSVMGRVVSPRGENAWGWDPIFEEGRSKMTFAEMDISMKSKFSHRSNAITVLKKYLAIKTSEANHSL